VTSALRVGSALVSVGLALPLATVAVLPYLVRPADTEDYGAGILAVLWFLCSVLVGLTLCGIGAVWLASALKRRELAHPIVGGVFAVIGAVSAVGMVAFLGYFLRA